MNQSDSGKAFEAAVMQELIALYTSLKICVTLLSKSSGYYEKALKSLNNAETSIKNKMIESAKTIVLKLQERIPDAFNKPTISLNFGSSKEASEGDVRDIVMDNSKKVYGLSLKWNSEEIKSFRLGGDWLYNITGIPINSLWQTDTQNFLNHATKFLGTSWESVKEDLITNFSIKTPTGIYIPIRDGVINQLCRIQNGQSKKFIDFVFGTKDYEKIMASVSAHNITFVAYQDATKPRRVVKVEPYLDNSNQIADNYVTVLFDKGWTIKIRIKNGDSTVKKNVLSGLKTTITVMGWGPIVPEIIPIA
jgi:HaeIII restriction endonuclease.